MINITFFLFICGFFSALYYQYDFRRYIQNNDVDYIFVIYLFSTYFFSYLFYITIQNIYFLSSKIIKY
jgi:hypothetical protein